MSTLAIVATSGSTFAPIDGDTNTIEKSAQAESTVIIGDGWKTRSSLVGQNDAPGFEDPAHTIIFGAPEEVLDSNTAVLSWPDTTVEGENTSELMDAGHDETKGATDSGGDQIVGADGDVDVIRGTGGGRTVPTDRVTCDAGFWASIGLKTHTSRFTNGRAGVATGSNLGGHANGND